MGVPSFGVCNEVGGTRGYRNIYIIAVEHGVAVHSYSPHSGPIPGYGDDDRIANTDKVMGSGGPGIPRDAG